jgi:tetratricopeptide (TPR) repeat protein
VSRSASGTGTGARSLPTPEAGPRRAVALALVALAEAGSRRRPIDDDSERYRREITIAEEAGDERGACAARLRLGELELRRGDVARALGTLGRALEGAERCRDAFASAGALRAIGEALLEGGDPAAAARAFGRSAGLLERAGHGEGLAAVQARRAYALAAVGDAQAALEASLAAFRSMPDSPRDDGNALAWLAVARVLESYAPAGERVTRGMDGDLTARKPPDPIGTSLDDVLAATALPPSAGVFLETAVRVAGDASDIDSLVRALSDYGAWLLRSGSAAAGRDVLRAARRVAVGEGTAWKLRRIPGAGPGTSTSRRDGYVRDGCRPDGGPHPDTSERRAGS